MGLADHVVNGGLPFDLPALKPFFIGDGGLLPKPEEFAPYAGFLDARIRYDRVKALLESVEGFTEKQLSTCDLHPRRRGHPGIRRRQHRFKFRTTNTTRSTTSENTDCISLARRLKRNVNSLT
jgi:hypothetical protein